MSTAIGFTTSLEKILPSKAPKHQAFSGEMLCNERFSFQVYFTEDQTNYAGCTLKAESPIIDRIKVRDRKSVV